MYLRCEYYIDVCLVSWGHCDLTVRSCCWLGPSQQHDLTVTSQWDKTDIYVTLTPKPHITVISLWDHSADWAVTVTQMFVLSFEVTVISLWDHIVDWVVVEISIWHECLSCLFVQSQQTQDSEPMLFQCWPTVYDVGPTLKQHWFSVLGLQGCHPGYMCECLQLRMFTWMCWGQATRGLETEEIKSSKL